VEERGRGHQVFDGVVGELDAVERNGLQGGEGVGLSGEGLGEADANAGESEAREVGVTWRQAELEKGGEGAVGVVHAEVGDGTGGGVVQDALDAVGLELPVADLKGEGEPVEAPVAEPFQGLEDRRRGGEGVEPEV
jgi:hypothetical protein